MNAAGLPIISFIIALGISINAVNESGIIELILTPQLNKPYKLLITLVNEPTKLTFIIADGNSLNEFRLGIKPINLCTARERFVAAWAIGIRR